MRPKSTLGARKSSKVSIPDPKKEEPYLYSQTFFHRDEATKDQNRTLLKSQRSHTSALSVPKRARNKFD